MRKRTSARGAANSLLRLGALFFIPRQPAMKPSFHAHPGHGNHIKEDDIKQMKSEAYTPLYDEGGGVAGFTDTRTGEYIEAQVWVAPLGSLPPLTPAQMEERRARIALREEREEQERRKKKWRKDAGVFFFVNEDLKMDLRPETLARLLFLGCYVSYDETQLMYTQRTPLCKSDLPDALGISRASAYRFLDEVSGRFLEERDGCLYLSSELFVKGRLRPGPRYQRFHEDGLRSLYRSCKPSQHRYLGYVFSQLPYINEKYNVLCRNPRETELDRVIPLTVDEFCAGAD